MSHYAKQRNVGVRKSLYTVTIGYARLEAGRRTERKAITLHLSTMIMWSVKALIALDGKQNDDIA
jgi:hypothetical protein